MLKFRTALTEQLIAKYTETNPNYDGTNSRKENKLPRDPKQVTEKGKCANKDCEKGRISYQCNKRSIKKGFCRDYQSIRRRIRKK